MKSVLAIYYSQSGQLKEIIKSFTSKYAENDIHVEYVEIEMVENFPFPWNGKSFFSVMPDSVLGKTREVLSLNYKREKYDLIILGYQPWFLSPSIPINSVLNDSSFQSIARHTPVIAITGARNMWVMAFKSIKAKLDSIEAPIIGHIALVDRHNNYVSLFTILHWLFGGIKNRWLFFFPLPGVSQNDIDKATDYGEISAKIISNNNSYVGLQEKLLKLGAVEMKIHLLFLEKTGSKMFRLWAQFIARKKNQTFWLILFKYYLFTVLIIFSPIILTLYITFVVPFMEKKIKEELKYYSIDILTSNNA